jgi:hypothetical protein
MMEYWKVEDPVFSGIGFKGRFSFISILKFPVNMNFTNNPFYHFPITQYSTIPLFQHSNWGVAPNLSTAKSQNHSTTKPANQLPW